MAAIEVMQTACRCQSLGRRMRQGSRVDCKPMSFFFEYDTNRQLATLVASMHFVEEVAQSAYLTFAILLKDSLLKGAARAGQPQSNAKSRNTKIYCVKAVPSVSLP
jgi:hypothetical protein